MTEAQWERFRNMSDEEIHRRALADPDAQPATPAFWETARLVAPAISICLDAEVLAWFKRSGDGYTRLINAVLRSYVEAQRKGGKGARR